KTFPPRSEPLPGARDAQDRKCRQRKQFACDLSALPLLESGTLGYAPYALSFLLAFAAGNSLLPGRGPARCVSACANLCHLFAQSVLQLRNAFAGNRGNLVEIELEPLRVFPQRGDLLRIGHVHL